jgi:hypothetical protein
MEDRELYRQAKKAFLEENPGTTVNDVRKTEYSLIMIMYTKKGSPKINIKTMSESQATEWIRDRKLRQIGI